MAASFNADSSFEEEARDTTSSFSGCTLTIREAVRQAVLLLQREYERQAGLLLAKHKMAGLFAQSSEFPPDWLNVWRAICRDSESDGIAVSRMMLAVHRLLGPGADLF